MLSTHPATCPFQFQAPQRTLQASIESVGITTAGLHSAYTADVVSNTKGSTEEAAGHRRSAFEQQLALEVSQRQQ